MLNPFICVTKIYWATPISLAPSSSGDINGDPEQSTLEISTESRVQSALKGVNRGVTKRSLNRPNERVSLPGKILGVEGVERGVEVVLTEHEFQAEKQEGVKLDCKMGEGSVNSETEGQGGAS